MELLSHAELPDGNGRRATYSIGAGFQDFSADTDTLHEMAIKHVVGQLDPLTMAGVKGHIDAALYPPHPDEYDPLQRDWNMGMADVGSGILFQREVHTLDNATEVFRRSLSGGTVATVAYDISKNVATIDFISPQAA